MGKLELLGAAAVPRPIFDVVSVLRENSFSNEKRYNKWTFLIQTTIKISLAAGIVFVYLRNVSIPTAVQLIKNNPVQSLLCAAAIQQFSYSIPSLSVGGWLYWQSLATLVAAVVEKNGLKAVYAVGGTLASMLILASYNPFRESIRSYGETKFVDSSNANIRGDANISASIQLSSFGKSYRPVDLMIDQAASAIYSMTFLMYKK